MLMRGRAPQNGKTPLWVAAEKGNVDVVQLLVKAGADKNAPNNVREGRDVGRTNDVFLCFLLGVAARLLTGSVLSRVGELCDCRWTGIALVGLRARSGARAIL